MAPQCNRDALATHGWLARVFFYGAQATTPFPPCGDHTTTSTNVKPGVLSVYEAFTPLWKLLQHKRWVLLQAAVAVNDTTAAAVNIFSIRGGLAVPVLNVPEWGQRDRPNATVEVSISSSAFENCSLSMISGDKQCVLRYAGQPAVAITGKATSVDGSELPSKLVFEVALQDGFAVLVCTKDH